MGQLWTIRVKIFIAFPSKGRLRSPEVTNRHLPITVQCFGLHVPIRQARTMNRALFSLPFARVNTVSSGLFLRIPRTVNHFLGFVETADLFFDSLGQLKRQSVLYVSTLPPVV